MNEVNSRAKVPSNKTTNRNKPVEQISVAKKPERHVTTGPRFSIKKTSVVHEKIMIPRSCLRWKHTGRIFKTVSLRWVPTGKIFTSSTTKVDSEPTNGSNEDITNQYECKQTLDVSAGTLNLSAGNGYLLKDKNEAKTDKTEHENGKSVKSQSKSQQVKDKDKTEEILNGPTRTHLMGRKSSNGQDWMREGQSRIKGQDQKLGERLRAWKLHSSPIKGASHTHWDHLG
ncbi:hypothetical protein Tco_1315661 [Tanacetum coccineum]